MHAFRRTNSKDPDIHVLDRWMLTTNAHPACTIHIVSVSAQDGIVALRKAHTCSSPPLSSLPKVVWHSCPRQMNADNKHTPSLHHWLSFSSRWHHSAQKGPYALVSSPSLSSLPKVALKTVPMFVWLNTDCFWHRREECQPLPFSPPLPSGDQCHDALAYPCSESSSCFWAPLPCQAADQMRYLLCLLVYLPLHSHRLWHAPGQ